jgi:hypothetical protein
VDVTQFWSLFLTVHTPMSTDRARVHMGCTWMDLRCARAMCANRMAESTYRGKLRACVLPRGLQWLRYTLLYALQVTETLIRSMLLEPFVCVGVWHGPAAVGCEMLSPSTKPATCLFIGCIGQSCVCFAFLLPVASVACRQCEFVCAFWLTVALNGYWHCVVCLHLGHPLLGKYFGNAICPLQWLLLLRFGSVLMGCLLGILCINMCALRLM